MSDITEQQAYSNIHPREDVEFARDIIHDRLLGPVPVQPFQENGDLTPEARAHVEETTELALAALVESGESIPADMIAHAVAMNSAERFNRTAESVQAFFDAKLMSPTARRIFALHEHDHPEDAMIFFKRTQDLPSVDVGAALCHRDTYTIARDILARTEMFPSLTVVDDDMPRLKTVSKKSDIDGREYVIITSKKIIAQAEETTLNYTMKRRKTYVISADELRQRGLVVSNGSADVVDTESLAAILQRAEITPDYLYPVVESVFIERRSAVRAIEKHGKLAAALGRRVRIEL